MTESKWGKNIRGYSSFGNHLRFGHSASEQLAGAEWIFQTVGSSWRVDETYIKVKGQWRYLYRAVDNQGQTVDFLLSKNCDNAAAVRFFKKAIGGHEAPEKITLDGSQASHQAVAELKAEGVLPAQTLVRTNKYLNNLIEQDHRKVKRRYYPMLAFKTFGN